MSSLKHIHLNLIFWFFYSGNIGLGHHVPVLVEVARKMSVFEDIMFVIMGEVIINNWLKN